MSKNLRERIMTAAVISVSVALGFGLSLAPAAFAQNDPGVQNDFGQAASGSDPGFLGQHSREGADAGDAPYTSDPVTGADDKAGRLGIGNVGPSTPCDQKLTPGELARFLQTGLCPP